MRKLIADKKFTVKDLQALIGVHQRFSPGAWSKWMNGKYKDDSWAYSNEAYNAAAFFFWKEKKLGKDGELKTRECGSKGKFSAATKTAKEELPDLSGVETLADPIRLDWLGLRVVRVVLLTHSRRSTKHFFTRNKFYQRRFGLRKFLIFGTTF